MLHCRPLPRARWSWPKLGDRQCGLRPPTCPQAIGRDVSWKTAPRPAVLAAYSDIGYSMILVVFRGAGTPLPLSFCLSSCLLLFGGLFRDMRLVFLCLGVGRKFLGPHQARNTVVSHANLVAAIMSNHQAKPCVFAHDPRLAAASISAMLRQLLAKFRESVRDENSHTKLRAKVAVFGSLGSLTIAIGICTPGT